MLLPTSAVLSLGLEKRGNIAVASGDLTGTWKRDQGNNRVAINTFRTCSAQNLKEAKEVSITPVRKFRPHKNFQMLWKRVPIWRMLSHPNILTFRSVNMTSFQLCLVYDWGYHGDVMLANTILLARDTQLFHVAKGLEYLYYLDIPHGGLKRVGLFLDPSGAF